MNRNQTYWGLCQRRSCLFLTWRGLILLMASGSLLLVIAAINIHQFLAVTKPVSAEILVVEGWLPDYALDEVRIEFGRHNYRKIYVTGGPLEIGGYLSRYKTYAEIGAATLIQIGMAKEVVEAIPAPASTRDRTYASAIALKTLLVQNAASNSNINLVSVGAHAKRSQQLFQRAFGDFAKVGVLSIENQEYDPTQWWSSSSGVRTVINEFVAYLYAQVVFPLV